MSRRLIYFFAPILATLLWACSQSLEAPINDETKKKVQAMNTQTISSLLVIPPIDAATPEIYETATFGLG